MFAISVSRKSWRFITPVVILAMVLSACATPTPQVIKETVVVEKPVEKTVVVEKPVEKTVVVEKTVIVKETVVVAPTATPAPTKVPVKTVYGNLPRNETLIFAGTASHDVWDNFNRLISARVNAYNGSVTAVAPAFLMSAGKLYPFLAQKWEYNADGTEMTLYLTKGATWNDGKPVTVDDWIFTFDYLAANKDKGVGGWLSPGVAYRAEGDDKIVFSFTDPDTKKPTPDWRFHRTFWGYAPLPKHVWEGQDAMTFANNPPVEAGPYKLVNCNADTKTCIWQRRDDYWKKDAIPAPKYVVYTRQPESKDLLVQELLAGNYDIAQLPYVQTQAVMAQNKNIKMVYYVDPCPRQVRFNVEHPPLDDPAMRHALSLLIDREKARRIDTPPDLEQIVPWPYAGKPDPRLYDPADIEKYDIGKFDPQKAAKILDDAGYKLVGGKRVDKNGKPISLQIMSFDPSIHGAAVAGFPQIMADAAATIGLEILPKAVEVGTYFSSVANGDFDIAYAWGCGAKADPSDPLGIYTGFLSENYKPLGQAADFDSVTRYKNPELDALVKKARGMSPTDPAISEVYKSLFHIITRDKPFVSLFGLPMYMPVNTEYWTGWVADPPILEPWYWNSNTLVLLEVVKPAK